MTAPAVPPAAPHGGPYSLTPAREAGVVLVHVPKTGGTSIARALYGTDGVGHRTARDLRDELGAGAWARAFTFAVVREPVDRLASAFRYLKAGGSNRLDAAFRDRALGPYPTLDAFVLGWLTPHASRSWVHFRPQSDFVCDGRRAPCWWTPSRATSGCPTTTTRSASGPASAARSGGPTPARPAPRPRLSGGARARVAAVYADDFARFDYPAP